MGPRTTRQSPSFVYYQEITAYYSLLNLISDSGRVVLGGWCVADSGTTAGARWFSLEVSPTQAPWLFDSEGNSSGRISAAELLATLLSVQLFYDEGARAGGTVSMSAGTDNLGNQFVLHKLSTTKMPLAAVLWQLTSLLQARGLWLDLAWIPRESNVEADALTNADFVGFDPRLRIDVSWEDVDLGIASRLLALDDEWRRELAALRDSATHEASAMRAGFKKRRVKQPWG